MLEEILFRIQKRLKAVGLTESNACTMAGLSSSTVRNMRRALKDGKDQGVSTKTIAKLAPVLQTTVAWLIAEEGPEIAVAPETAAISSGMEDLRHLERQDYDDLQETFSMLLKSKLDKAAERKRQQ